MMTYFGNYLYEQFCRVFYGNLSRSMAMRRPTRFLSQYEMRSIHTLNTRLSGWILQQSNGSGSTGRRWPKRSCKTLWPYLSNSMQASVEISPTKVTSHEGAVISLCVDGGAISELYFDFSVLLKAVRHPSETALDFLLVAASVYSQEDLAGTVLPVKEEIDKLPQRHSDVLDVFKSIANKKDVEAYERYLADQAEREKELEKMGSTASRADAIAFATKKTISERMDEDPAFYRKFSRMLSICWRTGA